MGWCLTLGKREIFPLLRNDIRPEKVKKDKKKVKPPLLGLQRPTGVSEVIAH